MSTAFFLDYQAGTAKIPSVVRAQGRLWEPKLIGEAGAQKPSTGSAVGKESPDLHWSSTIYPERRPRRRFHFFCIRNAFYYLFA